MYLLCVFKVWIEVRYFCLCGLLFGGFFVFIYGEGWF